MNRSEIIQELDEEIAKLYRAKELLQGSTGLRPALAKLVGSGIGYPMRRKRNMTPEGRKRIADAQKLRWAKQKAGKK